VLEQRRVAQAMKGVGCFEGVTMGDAAEFSGTPDHAELCESEDLLWQSRLVIQIVGDICRKGRGGRRMGAGKKAAQEFEE
jgi:hypothetical protein